MTRNFQRRHEGGVVVVTGAGQGIGRSVAIRLAAEGAHVVLVGRTASTLAETASLIDAAGGTAETAVLDIGAAPEVAAFFTTLLDRTGRLDVLVNNAAVFDEPAVIDSTAEAFRTTFDTNVVGTFLMSQAAARHMSQVRRGAIVHISSVDAFGADGPYPAYAASKAAVSSLARTMTLELAPLGVRVNTVAPGFVNSDMLRKTSTPAVLDHMLHHFARVPMRRVVEPEEIAAAVAFLASDDASAISGIDLVVDGGVVSNLYIYETLPEAALPLGV